MDMFFALGQYPNLRCRSLMTGTAVEITFDAASADLIPNVTLAGVNHQELNKIGGASFSNSEKEYAATIQKTFARDVQARIEKRGTILSEHVNEFAEKPTFLHGSTDVGDVSWIVPTGQVSMATAAYGTPPHSWQVVAQGKTSHAHKAMLQAGKVLAAAAVRCLKDNELMAGRSRST